jgi:excinuclease ABC subunit C
MEQAASELQFERAAAIRDKLNAIQKVVERQKVIFSEYVDSDVIAMARSDGEACVQVFFIRNGKLIGREYFLLEGADDTPDKDVMAEFIKQFYDQAPTVPPQVLLPHEVEEASIIKQWLSSRRSDQKVEIVIPTEGRQQELIQLVAENATETLASLQAQWQADTNRQTEALGELQEALNLPSAPNRIECYDISNTQGTAAVGSMVVFEQGVPRKKFYRRFNIRTVTGPDDFASMEEVLTRRFNRWGISEDGQQAPGKKTDLLDRVPVAALAKQREELFLPGRPDPILLPRHSQALYLVQRIRDEAHRFAITSHRKRRVKNGLASRLDSVPGIGPVRRKSLLNHFGSIQKIQDASIEELSKVPGITVAIAESIKSQLE